MSPTARTIRSRPDAAAAFFGELASKQHAPLLHHATGTLRVDLKDGDAVEHWLLSMSKGDVTVSRRNAKADAILRMDKKLFEGMAKGTVNLSASMLRGVLEIQGDLTLITAFDRLLPGPRRSKASFLERQKELER